MAAAAAAPLQMRRMVLTTSLLWVLVLCRGCTLEEEKALLSIQSHWSREFGYVWSNTTDCCAWEGVACGRHGRVVSLSLAQTGIRGALDPAVLAPLSELVGLDLSRNQIAVVTSHAEFHGLQKLEGMRISDNRLTDDGLATLVKNLTALSELHAKGNQLRRTSWISNLTSLKVVDMSWNHLQESDGVCNLYQLESLNLESNLIGGNINPCLGKLQHLTYLDLGSNFLTWDVGENLLSNMSKLETIRLKDNNLTGLFLFSSVANKSNLRNLDLSNNHQLEIETELVRWTPLFQLSYLILTNCSVNKRSNGIIPTFLSTQLSLQWIDFSHCLLQGQVPSWLFYNLSGGLLLHGNDMDFLDLGGLGNKTSPLSVLDLSDNSIAMSVPVKFASHFQSLLYLDMSNNRLHGGVPSLAEATFLMVLDLSFNDLDGEISPWLTGNGSVLTSLLLSHNKLQGPMPPFHWGLGHLIHLSIENNCISGHLPLLLPNSTSLETLNVRNNDLSGIIPDGLLASQSLGAVLLAGNSFHGGIPWDLCFNDVLHFIDLSDNRFSGEIPSCFYNNFWTDLPMYYNDDPFAGNISEQRTESVDFTTKGENLTYKGKPLTLMTGIDFSMNQLSGTIPRPIGFLRQLKSLNLSHNSLVGPIPDTFVYLQEMESLDLSHNHLNGSLPLQLLNLSFLSTFSVAYNNLSGEIPFGSQFSTFNDTAFEGNEYLCGEIIKDTCPSSTMYGKVSRPQVSLDAMDTPLVYWSFVAGSYAIGFWGVLALLAWNAGCRRRLCSLMDACMYKLGWSFVP